MEYTVIYRTGGTENFRWHRTLLQGPAAEMRNEAVKLNRSGYATHVIRIRNLEIAGLPETYE